MRDAGYRERWMKQIGTILTPRDGEGQNGGFAGPKEFLGALASWAGKGRDELLQVICREIGQATAGVLKEPLTELMRHRKLQITIELMQSDESEKDQKYQSKYEAKPAPSVREQARNPEDEVWAPRPKKKARRQRAKPEKGA